MCAHVLRHMHIRDQGQLALQSETSQGNLSSFLSGHQL